jgi:pimeloyl-ACP methyl ester carboxylesterase
MSRRSASHRNWRGLLRRLAVTVAVVGAAPSGAQRLELTDCARDIGVNGAECGTLEVFEDRAAGQGRRIGVHVAVLPALGTETRPDPLFMFAGGPGGASTDLAGPAQMQLRRVRETHEIVLVDQRGTGDSNPLDCRSVDADTAYYNLGDDYPYQVLQDCLGGYDADPRLYTTSIAMDDVDDIRAALGYEQINLWGGSYGTRAALVYLRRHPEHVRSVILDGLAPPAIRLPLHVGEDAARALDRLFSDCEADADCDAAFPGVRAEFDDLLARLEESPASVQAPHPRTGEVIDFDVTRDGVVLLLRAALYSAEASRLLPLIISRAHDGDYASLLALSDPVGEVEEHMSIGLLFSVLCAEDLAFIDDADRAALDREPLLGTEILETWGRVCGFWPRGEVPPEYHEPVVSETPVLLFSGDLDPVTPPRWGESVAAHLTNSKHVVVPGAAHGTLQLGCVQRLVRQFLADGSVDSLDASCVEGLRRPRFFTSFTGPRVGAAE